MSSWWVALCFTAAWSQEPSASPTAVEDAPPAAEPASPGPAEGASAPAADDDGGMVVHGGEEVLVLGEHIVSQARAAVIRTMEELGYKAVRERNGTVILRPPEAWWGKAKLTPWGDLELGGPGLAVDGPRESGGAYNADAMLDRDQQSGTLGLAVVSPSQRKLEGVYAGVRTAVEPGLVAWREAIRRRALGAQLETLPDRLAALWERGEGLGREQLDTVDQRKEALLSYWATRTDTVEGRAVTRTIEMFLREVVQASEHPITAEEAEQAEARREDGRRLDL